LGPVRAVVQNARDDAMLEALVSAVGPGIDLALDFRHESWRGVEGVVAVNDLEAEPFRYVRLREPPYADAELETLVSRVRAPPYAYARHEDEPTAPAYAALLRQLVADKEAA